MVRKRITLSVILVIFLLVFQLPFNAYACSWTPLSNTKIIWSNSDEMIFFDSGPYDLCCNENLERLSGRYISELEIKSGKINTMAYSKGPSFDFSISPDEKYFAYSTSKSFFQSCSGFEPELIIQDMETGDVHKNFSAEKGSYPGFFWSPDGTKFVLSHSLHSNSETYIYDSTTWELVANYSTVFPFSYSPDGKYILLTHDDNITLIDTSSLNEIQIINNNNPTMAIEWSPDSSKIIYVPYSDYEYYNYYELGIYDTSTWQMIKKINGTGYSFSDVKWSPDGTQVAVGVNSIISESTLRADVAIYETGSWNVTEYFETNLQSLGDVAWSNDGSMLAVGDRNNPELWVYDTDTWELKYIFIDSVEDEIKPSDVDLIWPLFIVSVVVISFVLFIRRFLKSKKKEEM